mgnify:CR=1 FL=1
MTVDREEILDFLAVAKQHRHRLFGKRPTQLDEFVHQNLVALLDVQQEQRDMKCRGAAVKGDAMLRAAILGKIFFKLDDIWSETKGTGVEVAGDGRVNFFAQGADLRREVEVWDFVVHLI